MKKIYFIIAISLFLLFTSKVQSESINLYGFKPASVDSVPLFHPQNKPIQFKENVFVTLYAEIDKKGELKSLKPQYEKDGLYLSYVESFIQKLTFQPAMFNNKKIHSVLPIDIVFIRRVNSPTFNFPLLQDRIILSKELFERTCELNYIELPKVLSFPSYFSDISVMDTSNRYPFVIEKLSFTDGELSKIENQISTHDAFMWQVESAILYADIKLPKIKGNEISTDLFLMVSFFPQLSYPVRAYDHKYTDSSNILLQKRVRFINRTSQLLSEPLPKRIPSDRFPRKIFGSTLIESIEMYVKIDSLGNTKVLRSGSSNKRMASAIQEFASKLKFYPPINQMNELVVFYGYIRIEPLNATDIRVSYLWLK